MKSAINLVKGFAKIGLAASLVLSLTVNVNAQYRKSWDFTKWSAATVANLKAVNTPGVAASQREWSDVEKSADTNPTETSKDNCFWEWQAHGSTAADKYVTANGEVISELEGLYYTNTTLGSLAIAINYPKALSDYKGAAYLWLGGSKKDYFVIPHVALGETIKMGVESHKASDARGVELYVYDMEAKKKTGDKFTDPDGNAVAVPTVYEDQTWIVPKDITAGLNEDGTVNVLIYNTNGCHIYYITVGTGDGDVVVEAKKVAYVTGANGSGELDDALLALQGASDKIELTEVKSDASVTLATLQEYEAIVVSPYLAADDAMVSVLKSAIAYQPMLNLNSKLYAAWGYGTVADSETATLTVPEAAAENEAFEGLDLSDGLALMTEGVAPYVTLGGYFANDAVLAYAGEGKVAIHQHNAGRNAYMFIPYVDGKMNAEVLNTLVPNAAFALAGTKKGVTAAAAPSITVADGNMVSTVTIAGANGAKIYYTLDGTEPTEASTVYTEPFDVKEKTTVKAFATLDGYLKSAVAEKEVIVKSKAATPAIEITQDATSSTVKLSCATEGANIYYAFWNNGVTLTTANTTKYTEPIVLSVEPTNIYAFAAGADFIDSDIADAYVAIKSLNANTIRMDTVSHFSASEQAWFPANPAEGSTGAASAHYYWGKNAWGYYDTDNSIGDKEVEDPETGEIKKEPIYAADPNSIRVMTPNEGNGTENDWRLFSQGQVLTGELTLDTQATVGNGATGRYHETAADLIGGPASKSAITFGAKNSGEPYSGAIESVKTFTAPFDVVVYAGNGNGSGKANMEIQTSTDGKTWNKVGDVALADTQRYIKKTRVSVNEGGDQYVRVAHTGGGTKAQVYDVYVLNNGTLSKQYDGTNSIEDVFAPEASEVVAVEVYTVDGIRLGEPRQGLNIIRTVYADGSVKVEKVVIR